LSRQHAALLLPFIYGPLFKNSAGHWNTTVEGLAQNVLKIYMEYDMALYDRISSEHQQTTEAKKRREEEAKRRWEVVQRQGGPAV
jgi:serine/threonine-protein phosphatase 2A regulatory subunit B'